MLICPPKVSKRGNMATYRKLKTIFGKTRFKLFHEFCPNLMLRIIDYEVVSFLLRAVSTNGWDVQHALDVIFETCHAYLSILDKSPSFNRQFDVGDVAQTEVNNLLQPFLAQLAIQRLRTIDRKETNAYLDRQRFCSMKTNKTVFREDEVKFTLH